jgi:hypothetical protein
LNSNGEFNKKLKGKEQSINTFENSIKTKKAAVAIRRENKKMRLL